MNVFFDHLRCPWCKRSFEWHCSGTDQNQYKYGTLSCLCHQFPVVMDIPILRKDALTELATSLVTSEQFQQSVSLLLNKSHPLLPFRNQLGRLARKVSPNSLPGPMTKYLKQATSLDLTLNGSFYELKSFREAMEQSKLTSYGQYLLYRPFAHDFWNLQAMLPLINKQPGPILDYGAGVGQSTQLMSKTMGKDVYNLEPDFTVLYYYKRYVEPDGLAVHIGLDNDIPFESDMFGCVVDLDGFHYVRNKYAIASEYERVTNLEGYIFLLHTRNRHITDDGFPPLSPQEYARIFDWQSTVFPETDFLTEFMNNQGQISLSPELENDDQDINFVLNRDTQLRSLNQNQNPLRDYGGTITVNPLYEYQIESNLLRLSRSEKKRDFRERAQFSYTHSDPECDISPSDRPWDYLKRGILTVLPEQYAGNDDISSFFRTQ